MPRSASPWRPRILRTDVTLFVLRPSDDGEVELEVTATVSVEAWRGEVRAAADERAAGPGGLVVLLTSREQLAAEDIAAAAVRD